MNIKLRDLKSVLFCIGICLMRIDTSEECQAKVSDIEDYVYILHHFGILDNI